MIKMSDVIASVLLKSLNDIAKQSERHVINVIPAKAGINLILAYARMTILLRSLHHTGINRDYTFAMTK